MKKKRKIKKVKLLKLIVINSCIMLVMSVLTINAFSSPIKSTSMDSQLYHGKFLPYDTDMLDSIEAYNNSLTIYSALWGSAQTVEAQKAALNLALPNIKLTGVSQQNVDGLITIFNDFNKVITYDEISTLYGAMNDVYTVISSLGSNSKYSALSHDQKNTIIFSYKTILNTFGSDLELNYNSLIYSIRTPNNNLLKINWLMFITKDFPLSERFN